MIVLDLSSSSEIEKASKCVREGDKNIMLKDLNDATVLGNIKT